MYKVEKASLRLGGHASWTISMYLELKAQQLYTNKLYNITDSSP